LPEGNIESRVSEDVVINLKLGLFSVNTEEGKWLLHTTYEGYSLRDLERIKRDEVHKKGLIALESLKDKDPEKYRTQRQYLEDNEKWFRKIHEYASNKDMVLSYAIIYGYDPEKAVKEYDRLYLFGKGSSYACARTMNIIYQFCIKK